VVAAAIEAMPIGAAEEARIGAAAAVPASLASGAKSPAPAISQDQLGTPQRRWASRPHRQLGTGAGEQLLTDASLQGWRACLRHPHASAGTRP
jgi:hypothetical protein